MVLFSNLLSNKDINEFDYIHSKGKIHPARIVHERVNF